MITLFFNSLLVAFSGAAMPGPLLVLTIDQTAKKGFWRAPLIIVGHSILEMAIVIGLVFGLTVFLGYSIVQGVIGIAGGGFLVYLGVMMIRDVPKLTLRLDSEGDGKGKLTDNPILGGILVSLSNPYWTLWWVTIGLAMMTKANALGGAGVGVFYVGHILGDFVWFGFIAVMITMGRRFVSDGVYRVMIGICAEFVLFLGATFVSSAVVTLLRKAGYFA